MSGTRETSHRQARRRNKKMIVLFPPPGMGQGTEDWKRIGNRNHEGERRDRVSKGTERGIHVQTSWTEFDCHLTSSR